MKKWQVDTERLEEFKIKPGVYKHYKGGEYLTLTAGRQVAGTDSNEDVGKKVVVYVALYDSPSYGPYAVWTRSLENFLESVEVDGKTVPRFRFVRDKP